MQISINGEERQLNSEELSILNLLEAEKVEAPEMVSVQVNGRVVNRTDYEKHVLRNGDEVDFLYFMGGGR